MRVIVALAVVLVLFNVYCVCQAPASGSVSVPAPGNPQASASYSMTPMLPELDRLQAAASATDSAIGRLRIDKWKADGTSKRQAESNAESIQRNLRSALPGMISAVRSSPQDLGAEFKLYRNLNALYDVMSSLSESAGAFGPKADYDALAQQLDTLESVRRNLGDSLEQLSASTQSQVDQLRSQVRSLQAQANAAPPKKTVVDDNDTPKKITSSTHKKKPKPPASDAQPQP
jgi:hypothetical protein